MEALGVVVVVALLSGCQGATDVDGAGSVEIPGPDRAALVLPLDRYTVRESDFVWESYLVELLVERCLTEQGLDFAVVRPEHQGEKGEEHRRVVSGFRTVETAEEWGYGEVAPEGLVAERAASRRAAESVNAYTDEQLDMLDGCYASANAEVSSSVFDLQDSNAFAMSISSPELAAEVRDAAAAWRECVAGQGLVLPEGTVAGDMPTTAMTEAFALAPDPAQAERETAVLDIACRESSGYDAARYQELWRLQQEAIEANAALFLATRDALEEARVRTRERIAELEADR